MGEETAKALMLLKNRKSEVLLKMSKYHQEFPDIDIWFDDFHKECQVYIKETEEQINDLVNMSSNRSG